MKKIVLMLLAFAATINVMAVDYTAKAIVNLHSTSGYDCKVTLRQAAEYGALNGLEINMEGREIAIYALNGTTKLQTAQAADFTDVKLGLKTDASTSYTFTVSSVAGTETLYIWDADTASYALTAGATYTFTAAAGATDEARFVIKKAPLPTAEAIVFNYDKLELTKYKGAKVQIFAKDATDPTKSVDITSNAKTEIDLSDKNPGRYVVKVDRDNDGTVADEDVYQIDVKVKDIPDSKYKEL